MNERLAIIGLGYVGLPIALAFASKCPDVIGFDIDERKLARLRKGEDPTGQHTANELMQSRLRYSSSGEDLKDRSFYIVTVPTPIDEHHRPDLRPLVSASELIGKTVQPGAVVVFESTVYPGVTEEVCGPIIEKRSGLKAGKDFFLGYSPERINPGDREHTFERIVKVVSGDSPATLERVASAYEQVVKAGIHRAESIRVAEAAKVIENTQRDLNIALMNELALIFDRIGISTSDVLRAASTKWNFMPFQPGLVGGHCIGVDPYYLTAKAEQLGYHPQVILAGRRINDSMGEFIARKTIKSLISQSLPVKAARVGVLGLTFKENVPDIRNSRIPDIVKELESYGVQVLVHDPFAEAPEAMHEYGIEIVSIDAFRDLDALIVAVAHKSFVEGDAPARLQSYLKPNGVVVDVKSKFLASQFNPSLAYWRL